MCISSLEHSRYALMNLASGTEGLAERLKNAVEEIRVAAMTIENWIGEGLTERYFMFIEDVEAKPHEELDICELKMRANDLVNLVLDIQIGLNG